jgi:Cof subfamily protein (haloacid dehalogenase superfamily)
MQIYKLLVAGLPAQEQREMESFIGTLTRLGITSSDSMLLDIIAAGADKGTGVQNLARLMGLDKEEICVFGDYHNDIPMFEAAGFSVAMGNAEDEVKNRATVITGSNDEDGVALAINKYFLGGTHAL